MANRRMFSKEVVLSDAFLDMSQGARLLYFTLGMNADDDGFVGNPKTVMRMCGCSEDNFKELLDKRYLLHFPSGIVVIKHWKMNNDIKNDRYKKTTYLEELDTLVLDNKKAYTEKNNHVSKMYPKCIQNVSKMDTEKEDVEKSHIYAENQSCIQNVSKMDTQVRLGKDSIGRVSIDKNSIVKDSEVNYTPNIIYIREECEKSDIDADTFLGYLELNNWKLDWEEELKKWKAVNG